MVPATAKVLVPKTGDQPLSLEMENEILASEPSVEPVSRLQVSALADSVAALTNQCEQMMRQIKILVEQMQEMQKTSMSSVQREAKRQEKQWRSQQQQQQFNRGVTLDELYRQREEQRRLENDSMRLLHEQQIRELDVRQEQQRVTDMLELRRQQQVVPVVQSNDAWSVVASCGTRKLPSQQQPLPTAKQSSSQQPRPAPANIIIGGPAPKRKRRPRKKKPRLDAVKVTALNEATYKDLYMAVRGNWELDDAFERPRRTGDKELTLYLNKAVDSGAALTQVSQAVGQTASAKLLTEMTTVEMKGVDMLVTVAEVAEAVEMSTGIQVAVTSILMRTRGDGLQVARMRVARRASKAVLCKVLQIEYTRVRMQELPPVPIESQRCFRCKERGHHSRDCKGVDRPDRCFNCGSNEHFAANCIVPTRCMACLGPHVVGI
ncbi:gag-like protein [Anopheles sinensis]|uniref:Gag-like protein n=1 Tax=Anopheles sinensis TaxID=74873 RepID=A0A084WAR9_ANOSI|nr:gag-like protein [Anopheles sinensis]